MERENFFTKGKLLWGFGTKIQDAGSDLNQQTDKSCINRHWWSISMFRSGKSGFKTSLVPKLFWSFTKTVTTWGRLLGRVEFLFLSTAKIILPLPPSNSFLSTPCTPTCRYETMQAGNSGCCHLGGCAGEAGVLSKVQALESDFQSNPDSSPVFQLV